MNTNDKPSKERKPEQRHILQCFIIRKSFGHDRQCNRRVINPVQTDDKHMSIMKK